MGHRPAGSTPHAPAGPDLQLLDSPRLRKYYPGRSYLSYWRRLMGKVLGLAFLVPVLSLGCGDDTGTNPGDAPMVDAPRLPDAAVDRPAIDAPSADADNTTPVSPNSVVCGLGG